MFIETTYCVTRAAIVFVSLTISTVPTLYLFHINTYSNVYNRKHLNWQEINYLHHCGHQTHLFKAHCYCCLIFYDKFCQTITICYLRWKNFNQQNLTDSRTMIVGSSQEPSIVLKEVKKHIYTDIFFVHCLHPTDYE